MLTETWFSDIYVDGLDGYDSFHSVRLNRAGESASVFVKNNLNAKTVMSNVINDDVVELCNIDTYFESGFKLYLVALYRPPITATIPDLTYCLESLMSQYSAADSVLLCGDFNIDLFNPGPVELQFIEAIRSLSLLPLTSHPTRVTENTVSLIDYLSSRSPINFHLWCINE